MVDGSLQLRFGRFHLDVFWNPGHTMSSLAVDIPEADLLHVGDTLVGNLAYLAYSSAALLDAALARLATCGRRRILASHGGVVGASALGAARHYLGALGARVGQALADGAPAIEAIPLTDCLVPGLAPSEFEDVFHRRNLATVRERGLF